MKKCRNYCCPEIEEYADFHLTCAECGVELQHIDTLE